MPLPAVPVELVCAACGASVSPGDNAAGPAPARTRVPLPSDAVSLTLAHRSTMNNSLSQVRVCSRRAAVEQSDEFAHGISRGVQSQQDYARIRTTVVRLTR